MFSKSICCSIFFLFFMATTNVQAGPLLDWLKSKCNRNNTNVPVGGYQATAGTFTQAPTTLMPGQCQRTCMQTCQKTVVNYVPYTAYRTDWQRVPVTQYKPVTSTDPCSGCTVTCMRPCTDYSWQLQRTPYTTYRPVYQTQSYKVPVTTITNDCANGGCSTCSTCGVPATGTGSYGTGGFVPSATGTLVNPGSSGVPADTIPTVSANRPAYGMYDGYPVPENYQAYSVSGYGNNGTLVGTPSLSGYGQMPANYTSPQAYSGMTQYSGYGSGMSAAQSNIYTQPMPSSYEAPQPTFSGSVYGGESLPADKTPILNDTTGNQGANLQKSQGTTLPNTVLPNSLLPGTGSNGVQSVLSNSNEAQPLTDPTPDMRWDFNVPQLGRPEDQSAHRDVQVRWAYTLTNGATHSDAIPMSVDAGAFNGGDVNAEWESSHSENPSDQSVNSDWN